MTVDAAAGASPFHAGEQAVQQRLGVRDSIEPWARKVVRTWMPDQHRKFYAQLPFVVAAARDERERPWVTMLTGEPGFISSPDSASLVFRGGLLPGDALEGSIGAGSDLGLLGIELDTRRRNRVNGTVIESSRSMLRFEVGQAFGNCPQYITEREWRAVDVAGNTAIASRRATLTDDMQTWIAGADTFFIGSGHRDDSAHASNGMDASHRGGPPGFVKVLGPTRLVFPDYAGNNHFNTIGNLVLDPRVALLFVDFDNGSMLQLTGRASIDWDSPDVSTHTGAKQLMIVDLDEVVELRDALPLRFSRRKGLVHELRLVERQQESDDVTSFYFLASDGAALPDFEAGQHLPVELSVTGQRETVTRTYSLSNGPGQGHYRISVKREPRGLVSRWLHDELKVGAVIDARTPAGDFVVGHHARPVVLISAGVGVTPVVSMLHELTAEPSDRPIAFLHGARDGRHHALRREVWAIAARHDNVSLTVAYSQPLAGDRQGQDFDIAGRFDAQAIRDSVSDLDAEFYLCGPTGFLDGVASALAELGVTEEQIHIETF